MQDGSAYRPVSRYSEANVIINLERRAVSSRSDDSPGFDFMIQHGRRTCHVSPILRTFASLDC